MKLTQGRLKQVLDYDPETGIFIRKLARGNLKLIGKPTSSKPRPNGYLCIRVDGKLYYAHRLAWLYWYGKMPRSLDHRDRDRTNNRIENLRKANSSQNRMNTAVAKNNTSGVKGVSWEVKRKAYRAQISKNGKKMMLGYFSDVASAAAAYKKEAARLFGDFAVT